MTTEQLTTSGIPAHLAEKKAPFIARRYLIGGLLLFGLMGMMAWATISTGAYYLTVDEVLTQNDVAPGQRIRVNGLVVDGSEDWNPQELTLRFAIYDENATADTGQHLPVLFKGPRPDNFQRAASAIIEGQMLDDGTFKADTLLLKCPSRYEETPDEEFFYEATG